MPRLRPARTTRGPSGAKPACCALLLVGLAGAGLGRAAAAPPVDHSGKPKAGAASYYASSLAGAPTASGEAFDPGKLTAASPDLPLGTRARVVNTDTGKSVDVTVNDRGPYVGGRVLDVSPKAAERLGMVEAGVASVAVQPVSEPAPPAPPPPKL